jgi:RNA polymerase sigma-70 factor (ECF subfamily)
MAGTYMKMRDAAAPTADEAQALRVETDPPSEMLRYFGADAMPLFRFCRGMLGSAVDAEDVVQDTFLKLLQHLQADGDRSNLRAWLFAVAANACRDRLRGRMRWLPWRAELDRRTVAPAAESTKEIAGTLNQLRARAALRALAPRDRLLLSLRAEGLSYREMSAAAGIAEQSVGKLLARAVARWKRGLKQQS